MTRVLVLAKEPVPGRVKTRLTPFCTPEQAAELATAALADTLAAVLATPDVDALLVLDGNPGPWLPAGLATVPQAGGDLGSRIGAAFDLHRNTAALLIGMDTPQVTPALLGAALRGLDAGSAVFGPAADGGWWALGLTRGDGDLVRGIETSTDRTGALQRARLVQAGLSVVDLPVLRDVDLPTDAAAVAAARPDSRFAAVWRALPADAEGAA